MILSNPDLDCPKDIVCLLKAENEGNIENIEELDPRLTQILTIDPRYIWGVQYAPDWVLLAYSFFTLKPNFDGRIT